MTSLSVPTPPAFVQDLQDTTFQRAVVQAAATMQKPEHNSRLQKAMDFVLTGAVTLHDNGTATVTSGSHTYQLSWHQNAPARIARPGASPASITWPSSS